MKSVKVVQKSLVFDGLGIIVSQKPSKYMRINVRPSRGSSQPIIKLTCPPNATDEAIMEFLHTHRAWISRVCDRFMQTRENTWEVLQSHSDEVLLFGQWVNALSLKELRSRLHEYALQRANIFAGSMGVCFSKLAVRTSRTRFGSCTHDRLSLSILLAFVPKEEIDYVIIHELAHIVHKNHSAQFWGLVGGSCTHDRLSLSILLAFVPKEEIDYVIIHELAHIVHKNHSAQFWGLVGVHCPQWKSLRQSLKSRYGLLIALLDKLEQASPTQAPQASPQSRNADIGSQLLFEF